MPDQTTTQTGATPKIDLAAQNKNVNDVLGIAIVGFIVLFAALFIFRRMSRTAKGGGCSGCSSSGCGVRGQPGSKGCQSTIMPGSQR